MPEGKLFVERRVYPRITVNIPAEYRLIEDPKELETVFEMRKKVVNTKTLDVSLGGMHILSETPLSTGAILRMEITLPDRAGPLTAFAEVVWSNEAGGGLRFLAMKEDDSESLKAYIKKASTSRHGS